MAEMRWNEALSVGHAGIDKDHQGLFALIEELEGAGSGGDLIGEIISRLEAYAAEHFAREEDYMRRAGYPGLQEHIRAHEAFVEWVDTVKATYRRAAESPFSLGDIVNDFLRRWLVDHIMTEDMKYRDYIAEKKTE